jgi:hypothetical protein
MKKLPIRQLLLTFSLSLAVLIGIVLAHAFLEVEIPNMMQDMAQLAHIHPLYGILQNLGVLLWCATAAISLFTAMLAYKLKQKSLYRFYLSGALLSAYLLFDDFFEFHEFLAPYYLMVTETSIMVALGIVVLSFLVTFRQIILQADYFFLLLSVGFLSVSVIIDFFEPWLRWLGPLRIMLEDSPKWLGIACWCSYFVHTSYQFILNNFGISDNNTRRTQNPGRGKRR